MLGRPIELVIEDNQTTNPGSVLAFSKLAGDKNIPGFIGPIHSTQVHAMAPDIQRVGKPVMFGGADPQLTHMGNPWLFRCRPNDIYSARVIADYGVNTLGQKKWAIAHSTDAYGTSGVKNLVEVLKGKGVEPVLIQGKRRQDGGGSGVGVGHGCKLNGVQSLHYPGDHVTFEGYCRQRWKMPQQSATRYSCRRDYLRS